MGVFAVVFLVALVGRPVDLQNVETTLDVAAFNVRIFGTMKIDNPKVAEILVKVILNYDLILIQEIRDFQGESINTLLRAVNSKTAEGFTYKLIVSERLGRSVAKEQYAFFYRDDWLILKSSYVFHDSQDVFEREPFIAEFTSSKTEITHFIAVGVHVKPSDAKNEINNLVKVYESLDAKDVVIMGDLNAGCSYVNNWDDISLASDPRFTWLLNNHVDTTIENSNCPYDRIVVTGDHLLKDINPYSSGVFRFDEEYDLSQQEALDVSDHYPVHFQVYSKYHLENMRSQLFFDIEDKQINNGLSKTKLYQMRRDAQSYPGYVVETQYTSTGGFATIAVTKKTRGFMDASAAIEGFFKDFPGLISKQERDTAFEHLKQTDLLSILPRGYGHFKTLYDFHKEIPFAYGIRLKCNADGTLKCFLGVSRVMN